MTGPELLAIRKAMGLTQEQMAAKMDLSPRYGVDHVSAMENGRRGISARTVRMLESLPPKSGETK
jgi:transcriptional regulator with XRE-family HTH domain